jgi:hypothetical protein
MQPQLAPAEPARTFPRYRTAAARHARKKELCAACARAVLVCGKRRYLLATLGPFLWLEPYPTWWPCGSLYLEIARAEGKAQHVRREIATHGTSACLPDQTADRTLSDQHTPYTAR